MSWQNDIYQRLRDREWHPVGALFEEIEQDIPLHIAMRRYLNAGKNPREMPANTEARWLSFKAILSIIGVESNSGSMRGLRWNNKVRITYLKDQQCQTCSGPVIRGGWSSRNSWVCLACESNPNISLELAIPTDLVSVKFLEQLTIDAIVPLPIPKQKRRHRRRSKSRPLSRPSPPPIAPPVLVKSPKLPKPIPKPEPRPDPRQTISTTINEIWDDFIYLAKGGVPRFESQPKVRRLLHRALEAGIIEEYKRMRQSVARELADLRMTRLAEGNKLTTATALIEANNLITIRAARWAEITLTPNQRNRCFELLIQAYVTGAIGILSLVINDNLSVITSEVERLISIKEPKSKTQQQPNRPPQPIRQRWGAPFRQARNVLNRFFTR